MIPTLVSDTTYLVSTVAEFHARRKEAEGRVGAGRPKGWGVSYANAVNRAVLEEALSAGTSAHPKQASRSVWGSMSALLGRTASGMRESLGYA